MYWYNVACTYPLKLVTKKMFIYILVGLFINTSVLVSAEIVRTYIDNNQILNTWEFTTEVSSYIGFNIDNQSLGIGSSSKITIESNINEKEDEYFHKQGKLSGSIKIKDFEIKVYNEYEKIEKTSTTWPINISWGDIEGTVYIGALYLKLAYNDHDRLDFIDSLDDGDLDFSVINYSIISISDTVAYKGGTSRAVGDVITFEITEERGIVGGDFIENANGALAVGYLFGDVLDLRVGISSENSYFDAISTNLNPLAFSLFGKWFIRDQGGFDFLSISMKTSSTTGVSNRDMLQEDNPIELGAVAQYKIPLIGGLYSLTSTIGYESKLEYLQIINPTAVFNVETADASRNKWILSHTYEIAAGITFDWANRGRFKDEDDYLNFKKGTNDKVTDGVSVGVSLGFVPNEIFRELQAPYLGFKLALWDSEDINARGLFPRLETGLILNINHTFGGRELGFHKYIVQYQNAPFSELFVHEKTDLGIGLQTKYHIAFVRPYINGIFKFLDFNTVEDTYKVTNEFSLEEARVYDNKVDMRFKIGTEIVGLVSYVEFEVFWESGDMIKTSLKHEKVLTEYDFFSNEDSTGNKVFVSHAKLGYISLGAKIKF